MYHAIGDFLLSHNFILPQKDAYFIEGIGLLLRQEDKSMMYQWDNNMMDGWGAFMLVAWLVVTVDLILLGVWLWKQIQKK